MGQNFSEFFTQHVIPLSLIVFPLEIPNFLTKEECEHLIKKAEETGLILSEVSLPDAHTTTDNFASEL